MITKNFEYWLNHTDPKEFSDLIEIHRVIKLGCDGVKYELVYEHESRLLKNRDTDLILQLSSPQSIYIFFKLLGERVKIDNFEEWCQTTPRIFKGYDSPDVILKEVVEYGIAGISGGRLEVRRTINKIHNLAHEKGLTNIVTNVTHDHKYTELANPYDKEKYNSDTAKQLIEETYDIQNPDT